MGCNFDLSSIKVVFSGRSFGIISNRLICRIRFLCFCRDTPVFNDLIGCGDGISSFVDLFFSDERGFSIEIRIGKESGGRAGIV